MVVDMKRIGAYAEDEEVVPPVKQIRIVGTDDVSRNLGE